MSMRDVFIHDTYNEIMLKIAKDGIICRIYGEQIDVTNIEHLVVAAYFLAQQEEWNKQAKVNEVWESLI